MLKLIIIGIFSCSLSAFARAPGNTSQLRLELQKTPPKKLISWINEFISASAPSRMIGLPGHDKARDFLLASIRKADPKNTGKTTVISTDADIDEAKRFYQSDFDQKVEGKIPKGSEDYRKWLRFTQYIKEIAEKLRGKKVENIVWEKAGMNPRKILVVVAHYDTINQDPNLLTVKFEEAMPGANYNASGDAVAMALISTLAEFDVNYTVQVVFLDWQSIGYLGSFQYAQELKKSGKDVLGVVNLEMLGQDTSFLDKKKKTGNMSVYTRNQPAEIQWAQRLQELGSKMTSKVTFDVKPNGMDISDAFRFWDQGYLAVTYSQNWEDDFNPKFYQSARDTSETLNQETLYQSFQFIGGAVIGTLLDLTK